MFDQLDDQRRFAALAEMGDIGAAAERLGITRNALSKTLARLEECCGIPLFERLPEGRVSLTPLGGEALEDVRQILQRTEGLQEKISAARSAATQDEAAGVKFSLRISASDNDRLDALLALLARTEVDGFGLKVSQKRLVRPHDARGNGPGRGRAARPAQGCRAMSDGETRDAPAAPCGPPTRDLQRRLPA